MWNLFLIQVISGAGLSFPSCLAYFPASNLSQSSWSLKQCLQVVLTSDLWQSQLIRIRRRQCWTWPRPGSSCPRRRTQQPMRERSGVYEPLGSGQLWRTNWALILGLMKPLTSCSMLVSFVPQMSAKVAQSWIPSLDAKYVLSKYSVPSKCSGQLI